ncbi:hypothetical protein PI125_g18783 [Phytophthora idaei]|nr:hypothetical protein PI125_g18783 [Phytophthora idaei]
MAPECPVSAVVFQRYPAVNRKIPTMVDPELAQLRFLWPRNVQRSTRATSTHRVSVLQVGLAPSVACQALPDRSRYPLSAPCCIWSLLHIESAAAAETMLCRRDWMCD